MQLPGLHVSSAGSDEAHLAAHKPALEALVSSLLGGSQAAASVWEVKQLPAAPSSTAAGRALLGMAEVPTESPSAFGAYSGGGVLAAVQQEAPGGHLQSGWRLLAGGAEVSFGDSAVGAFLQYEAPSGEAVQHDLSMASMHGSSGTVAAANLAVGMPVGLLPQAVPAGKAAAAGQQVGMGARPQVPAGQQMPQRPLVAGPANPAVQRPAGVQQPGLPTQPGGALGQQAGLPGQQTAAAAGGGAALWQAVGQLQAAAPAGKTAAGQQAGAGVQKQIPAVPSGAATKPAGTQLQPAVPTRAAVTPVPVQSPPPPHPPPKSPPPPPPKFPSPPPPQAIAPAVEEAASQPTKPGVLQVSAWQAAGGPGWFSCVC